ncbi:hypothetical protein SAMN03159496_05102 [Rhizobium sp. NFR07]|nr:hypothetical protein SAMN03159496_05102 [Rhizobium sp. NFR07]
MAAICIALLLINAFSLIDRILTFNLVEQMRADQRLTDTELGLITGFAFAVCYALLSLPLARTADQGSPGSRGCPASCWNVTRTLRRNQGTAGDLSNVLAKESGGLSFGERDFAGCCRYPTTAR